MASRPPLPDLAAVLAWREPADPRGHLRRRARTLLRSRIDGVLARAAPAWVGDNFRARFFALPVRARRRLLDDPELWGRVLVDLESEVQPFFDAVDAAHAGKRRGGWVRSEGIVPSETRAIHARLRAARSVLRSLCPNAAGLVRRFNQVVVLRVDRAAPDQWASESTEGFLGRIVLYNSQLPAVEEPDLVQALVHESVHTYLSTVELFHPFIPDRDAAADRTVTSPWTGASLDAQQFVHAALVWWSVKHLWAGAPARRAVAEAGFAGLQGAVAGIDAVLSRDARVLMKQLAR